MKQTFLAVGIALLVGLVPVSFVSQTVSALDLPILNDQVSAAKNTAEATSSNGNAAIAQQVHRSTNNGNHNGGNANPNANMNAQAASSADTNPAQENRFTANKLSVCEKHQDQILTNISTITDRGNKQLEVFHSIAERAKAFYAAKDYSAQGYDELAAAVDTLYDQSLVAVNTTESTGETWSCNGANPTAQLQQFRQAKETEMATLAAYKDKVHELLVLIKTAATSPAANSGDAQ